jgi:hypothetical protein
LGVLLRVSCWATGCVCVAPDSRSLKASLTAGLGAIRWPVWRSVR